MVEQLNRNQQVGGSSPFTGSRNMNNTTSFNFITGEHLPVNSLLNLIQSGIREGVFPGGVLLVGKGNEIPLFLSFGNRSTIPESVENDIYTVYDIASMTKPLATALITMILLEKGLFRLDDKVNIFMPEFNGLYKSKVTFFHLLTHTSGIAPWGDIYTGSQSREEAINKIIEKPLLSPPYSRVRYSCLGFILLADILEKVTQKNLAVLFKEEITKPLQLENSFFNPDNLKKQSIAPTEIVNGQLLKGIVHDPNARFLGGVSGNAGLFSDANDLSILARLFLNKGKYQKTVILSREVVEEMTRSHTLTLNENRGLGWDMRSQRFSSSGDLFSPRTIGHTGYTGTSIWIDLEREVYVIFLTNRVHPQDHNQQLMIRFRPLLHNLIFRVIS